MSTKEIAPRWIEVRPLGRARELAAVWMFLRRDFRQLTHFRFAFLLGLLGALPQLIIFGVIATFGRDVPELQKLSGNYVNFVISGLAFNVLLTAALTGPYKGLMDSFWNDRVEIIMLSPLRLHVFIAGLSLGNYIEPVLRVGLYLAAATFIFGLSWPAVPAGLAFLAVLVPALLACTGLGLAAASSVYTLDARGGQDPVILVVETLSGLVAGVYFPVQVMPAYAQWLAHIIPPTYAIDGMRRALFGDEQVPLLPVHNYIALSPLAADCLILSVYAFLSLTVGWKLFQYSMKLARGDGRLSRWT